MAIEYKGQHFLAGLPSATIAGLLASVAGGLASAAGFLNVVGGTPGQIGTLTIVAAFGGVVFISELINVATKEAKVE
ncbi:MAG: hypothetical protein ACREBJ_08290, partial [Nitrosotalea sp.]